MKNYQLPEAIVKLIKPLFARCIPSSFNTFLFFLLMIPAVLFSCTANEDTTVGFATSGVQRTESNSTYSVRIHLGKVTATTTVTIDIYGTAALDGDYSITAPPSDTSSDIIAFTGSSSVSAQQVYTVQAGETYAEVFFKINDDPFVEPRTENILFRISAISNESIEASLQNVEYQFLITDNDTPPPNALRADLSWRLGDGVSVINGNFDMYLVKNVVISSGQVVSKDLVDQVSSKNESGFESFNLDSTIPEDKYYIMIRYISGTYDADTELILSKTNSYSRASAHIASTSVGKDFYFGPITKSGSSYSRVDENVVEEPKFIKVNHFIF